MGSFNRTRIFVVVALVAGLLGGNAATALADDEGRSNEVIYLDERYEGWFSNGMINDPAACGPYTAAADAVVWHLYVELPDGVDDVELDRDDDRDDVEFSVAFGTRVKTDYRVTVTGDRADVWVRTRVKNPNSNAYARQGAHTSIEGAKLYLGDDDIDVSDLTLQLGRVCYEGMGPIGEVHIYLQGMVCDGYDRFEGNQVNEASSHWDSTGGDWQLWDKIFRENAPTVKVVGPTRGCSFSGTQRFAVGTSSSMANYFELPFTTNARDGLIKLSSKDLPAAHQQALLWANEELWFQRLDNQALGAFQCYEDRLHPDNFEWILIRNYNKLPSSITCIAWNVRTGA